MADRNFKFYIQSLSDTPSEITVKFNSVEIFSGTTPSITTDLTGPVNWQTDAVCEYISTTDLVGYVPFELTVTNGAVAFGRIEANYSGFRATQDRTAESSWPSELVVTVTPENFWADVNRNNIETDGKSNVLINGVEQVRNLMDPNQIGDWWYRISENETFTCDIFVDPECIVTEIPETFLPRQN
jgi:hypothetical protein